MAQQRPKILLSYGRINQPLRVPIIDLTTGSDRTFLTADTASGSSTLTVKEILGFAIGGPANDGKDLILLIGEPGNKGSEIIKGNHSTAPSGTTITLASNTVQNHASGTFVYLLNYDQVELSNAPTVSGSKVVITTALGSGLVTMRGDESQTKQYDTTNSSGYYFARFKNSVSGVFSGYSGAAPYNGYTILHARSLIDNALAELNKKTSDVLSDEYAFMQINNCQNEVLKEQKRWTWMQVFDSYTPITIGSWRVAMPNDIEDANSNKSIYNFRIAKNDPLTWIDKERWNTFTESISNTTLSVGVAINDATITCLSTQDFTPTGTVLIGSTIFTYTANDITTGILTLSTPATVAYTSSYQVFQNQQVGVPQYWTAFDGWIWFFPIIDTQMVSGNFFLDYYSILTPIAADTDVAVVPDPTLIQYYLKWKFLLKIQNGEETEGSKAHYNNYILRREKLKQKEVMNRVFKLRPRFNNWARQMSSDNDWEVERIRDGAFPNI